MTDTPISYRIPGAVAATGLTRSRIFELIAAGELRARKCGRTTLIERSELERYINSLPVVNRGEHIEDADA